MEERPVTRALLLTVLLLALADVSVAAGTRRIADDEADLLSGAALGLPKEAHSAVSLDEIVALDDDMRAFVMERTAGGDPFSKLNRLIEGMKELGLFALDYTVDETLTARASFHERRGNCLSFTLLFVVLAREAGLDVQYQVVNVPPTWSDQVELIVIGRHVDALVDIPHGSQYVVDFNGRDYQDRYAHRLASDEQAIALFYNNLGAEALLRKDYAAAFLQLRTAITGDPQLAAAWVNLGVLYWRIARGGLAEAAYRQALTLDPHNGSALTNLTSLYRELGRTQLAAEYGQRVRNYRLANPYYHYAIAQRAYDEQRFDDALRALRDAIRRKRDDPRFYELQGRSYLELGQPRNAEKSFSRARDHAPAAAKSNTSAETAALTPDEATRDIR
jgi:tetratricopeptide (TPR) repeat protein